MISSACNSRRFCSLPPLLLRLPLEGYRSGDQQGRAVGRANAHGEGKDTLGRQGRHHWQEGNRRYELVFWGSAPADYGCPPTASEEHPISSLLKGVC